MEKPTATTRIPTGRGTTKLDDLIRRLQYEFTFDPLDELIKLYRSKMTGPAEKMKIVTEIMSYCYPKLKAVEVKQDKGEIITVNVQLPDGTKIDGAPKLQEIVSLSQQTSLEGDVLMRESRFMFSDDDADD